MSSCCTGNGPSSLTRYSPSELNSLLIPVFLLSSTKAQQKSILEGNSNQAGIFRKQAWRFLGDMALATKYKAQKKFFCPLRVPWSTLSSILITRDDLVRYNNFYQGSNSGFAFILNTTIAFLQKRIKDQRVQSSC